jgi:hypothetical protein
MPRSCELSPTWEYAGTIPDLTQQEPEPGQATPFDATRICRDLFLVWNRNWQRTLDPDGCG